MQKTSPSKQNGTQSKNKSETTSEEGALNTISQNSVMMSLRGTDSLSNLDETRKVERITNEMIETNLIRHQFFHGFVLQELLLILLKSRGDFLFRLSHQPEKKGGQPLSAPNKPTANQEPQLTRVILVLSVNVTSQKVDITKSVYGDLDEVKQKENVDLQVCIEETAGKWTSFYIERRHKFASIDDLVAFYKANPIFFMNTSVLLSRPIHLQEWELKRQSIDVLTKKLGEGAYGEVFLGRWKEPFWLEKKEFFQWSDVAVKTMKNNDSRAALLELMHEARLQLQLKHKNVLAFHGVFLLKKPILLVSEFCELGSLKGYLQKRRVSVDEKLQFCVGSSCGLEYIHFKGLIHRDLATRNILVSQDKTPKIADFGLAKFGSCYTMRRVTKIPIRYLAPETLTTFLYSTSSDVYTFGLVIWEIFHNGQEPYTKAQAHQEKVVPKNVQLRGNHIKDLIKKELFVRFNPETPIALQKFVATKLFVTDDKKRPPIREVTTFLATLAKADVTKSRSFYNI